MSRLLAFVFMGLAFLAGCATPPAPEPVKEPEPALTPEPETPPTEEPAAASRVESKPVLSGPAARAEAQKRLRHAFELLNDGEEDEAKSELQYVHDLDPDNKAAACLLRGINADPLAALGKESTSYTVRQGESLGRIAQRALGDVCEFYLLARYNQIKVPKRLAAGQTIRIPGKVALAPPDASPAPAPQPAAPATPKPTPAPTPKPEPAPATTLKPESAPPPSAVSKPTPDEVAARQALIQRHHRSAQAAFRRQDLATAIKEWDKVLELDPSNELAKVRREEALDLARRLKRIK